MQHHIADTYLRIHNTAARGKVLDIDHHAHTAQGMIEIDPGGESAIIGLRGVAEEHQQVFGHHIIIVGIGQCFLTIAQLTGKGITTSAVCHYLPRIRGRRQIVTDKGVIAMSVGPVYLLWISISAVPVAAIILVAQVAIGKSLKGLLGTLDGGEHHHVTGLKTVATE